MKLRNGRLLRTLTMLMIVALLTACLPELALAEGFTAVVTSSSMTVAADAGGKLPMGSLPKNTVVTVKAHKKGVAKIEYKGKVGYAKVSDMSTLESCAEKAVTAVATKVYKKASGKGASKKLKAGTGLYVLATKGSVSMVVKDGAVGYVKRKHLILASDEAGSSEGMSREQLEKLKEELEAAQKKSEAQKGKEEKKEESKATSLKEAFKSGKYSNEQLCYLFLTQVAGYNQAATAGILANINYESGFKTSCVGDGGTSIGICQWHASRKTRLQNYCDQHGVKSDSLAAQLMFLKYELENYYPSVHKYLKSVSNTAQGAYDAGYYFCYHFESPAAKSSQSSKRASSAKSTYYPRYAKA